MISSIAVRNFLACATLAGLVACSGVPLPSFGGGAQGKAGAVELVQRDVEAPEVLDITEPGIWDGRQSNGGVWVSHPSLTAPERVIVRNPDNNSFVIGAMFRKDVTSGPGLRVSADAAQALGVTPGVPTPLSVTALRNANDMLTDSATDDPVPLAPVAPPAPTPTPSPVDVAPVEVAAPIAAAASLKFPFVQIGIFSTRANADKAAGQISGAGLTPVVTRLDLQGKAFWKVAIGPLATADAQAAALTTAKRLGYPDAFPSKS